MKKQDIVNLITEIFDTSNTSNQYEKGCIKLFSQLREENGINADEFIEAKNEVC